MGETCLGGQVCQLDTLLCTGSAKGKGVSLCRKQIRGEDKRKGQHLRQARFAGSAEIRGKDGRAHGIIS